MAILIFLHRHGQRQKTKSRKKWPVFLMANCSQWGAEQLHGLKVSGVSGDRGMDELPLQVFTSYLKAANTRERERESVSQAKEDVA